eukprot:8134821-Alexandrium_andersonii.AAC.1
MPRRSKSALPLLSRRATEPSKCGLKWAQPCWHASIGRFLSAPVPRLLSLSHPRDLAKVLSLEAAQGSLAFPVPPPGSEEGGPQPLN